MQLIPDATVDCPHTTELLIKRSRFYAQSCHVQGLERGRDFVERVRCTYPDANHHCWACVGGEAGDSGHAACSDDGEPHGTAGKPMLQILLHAGISEICVVVTRWFGGIKLGTGGLVRAYQDAIRSNIETLATKERRAYTEQCVVVDYCYVDALLRLVPSYQIVVDSQDYGHKAVFRLHIPTDVFAPFVAQLRDITKGACTIRKPEG